MNGWLIKRRLLELEITPVEFAKVAGFSKATAYNILAGKRVTDDNLFKAAKALKLKAVDLVPQETPLHSAHGRRMTSGG